MASGALAPSLPQGGELLLDALVAFEGGELGFEGRLGAADLVGIGFHLVNLALDIAVAGERFVDAAVIDLAAHADTLLGSLATHHQCTVLRLGLVELGLQLGQIVLTLFEGFLSGRHGILAAFDFGFGLLLGDQRAAGKVLWWAELGIRGRNEPPRDAMDVWRKLEVTFPELAGFVFWSDDGFYNLIGNHNGRELMTHPGVVTARDALQLDALTFSAELVRREEITVIL